MIHHGPKSYTEAASEAARIGRRKMEEAIHRGLTSAERMIEKVQNTILTDRVVKSKSLFFEAGDDGFNIGLHDSRPGVPGTVRTLHDHALRQVLEKADVPPKFSDRLLEKGDWGRELLLKNLNEIYNHSEERHLVREEKSVVKGFLSDRFRRLDTRPLLDSFVGAAQTLGMVPYEGYGLDTKVLLRTILPKVFEPIPNEVMAFGLEWSNSDFGNGANQLSLFVLRCYCTNLATGQECLRQVHLGKRLDDNIAYSQNTLELDTRANASALKDMVTHVIGPDRVNGYLEVIQKASADEIEGKDVAQKLKKYLTKGDVDKVVAAYESNDVVNLPPGNTNYRLSNAVSWLAQAKGTSEAKKLDLQRVAGELLGSMTGKTKEI